MKRTHHITCIAAALLLILLLPLLAGCADQEYPVASPEIPEGWEVVSTDENITYLQMKEGSEAYHWKNLYYFQDVVNLPIDMEIPGNAENAPIKPDQDGNVYFIVYCGRFYADKINGKYQLTDAPEGEEEIREYTLHMQTGGENWVGSLSGNDLFSQPWKLPALEEYNHLQFEPLEYDHSDGTYEPVARVGLTHAVLIACPYDKLENGWESLIFRIEQSVTGDSNDTAHSYGAWKGTVYFRSEDVEGAANPFFTVWAGVISLALLACSLVVMILTAIFKKNCFLHLIPIVLGIIYNISVLGYLIKFPSPTELDSLVVQAIFTILFFIIAGIALLIIRLLIALSRRIAHKVRAKAKS